MTYATSDERYFLELINKDRALNGQDRLYLERSLNRAADTHSSWMLQADVFSHTGQGGSRATDRIRAAGFDLSNGWATAENIAYVSINNNGTLRDEVEQLHRNLMNSPGHRANLLSEKYDLVGLGLQLGEFEVNGRGYTVLMITQNFATTGGEIDYDLAAGISIRSVSAPEWTAFSPVRATWAPLFDGQTYRSTNGQELIASNRSDDIILGNGSDKVNGRSGNDWIAGGGGADTIYGSFGNDFILGQFGNDLLNGNDGDDRISGGYGDDRLVGGAGHDRLRGDGGNDRLIAQDGNDLMSGGDGHDALYGDGGHDRMRGDGGNDQLFGGYGNDLMEGGAGADWLVGGPGYDSFIFRGTIGRDRIQDFQRGIDRVMIDDDLINVDLELFVRQDIRKIAGGILIELTNNQAIFVPGDSLTVRDVGDSIFLI